jgi:DNA-binding Lrp family transcriptional regulator
MINKSLDTIDRQLIGFLRKNARAPVSWLAQKIGVSRATVQNRMKRLEQQEVITGYSAIVSSAASDKLESIRAFMSIELDGNVFQKVRNKLIQESNISTIHSTNGRWDMIIEILTTSLSEFDKVLKRVRAIEGIAASETSILLRTERFELK